MALTIPDYANASFIEQAAPDSVDFDAIVAGFRASGVGSSANCLVTQRAAGANMSVDVAAGDAWIAGAYNPLASVTNVAVTADATNPRWTLISLGAGGAVSLTAGTAAASPVMPAIPAGTVLLAAIWVPAGAASILNANIVDKRIVLGMSPATTVTSETAFGQAASVGTAVPYARADHTHGTPPTPATSVAGRTGAVTLTAADVGTGTFPGTQTFSNNPTVSVANPSLGLTDSTFTGRIAMASAATNYHPSALAGDVVVRGETNTQGTMLVAGPSSAGYLRVATAGATVGGTLNSTGNLSENGNRVYSAGNAPPYPVTSVATRTGAVALTAADIAAGTFPGANSFSGLQTFNAGLTVPGGFAGGTTEAIRFGAAGGEGHLYAGGTTASGWSATTPFGSSSGDAGLGATTSLLFGQAGAAQATMKVTSSDVQINDNGTARSIPRGNLSVWQAGAAGTTATTTETAVYSGVGSWAFVSGRRYRIHVRYRFTPSAASTTARAVLRIRLGTGLLGTSLLFHEFTQGTTQSQTQEAVSMPLLCGTDFAAGTSALTLIAAAATGTLTSLWISGAFDSNSFIWVEDVGT